MDDTNGGTRSTPGREAFPARHAAHQFKPGQNGHPAGRRLSTSEECAELFRAAATRAARRLIEQIDDEDSRVANVACNSILDRVLGKPKEPDKRAEVRRPDLSVLTLEEMEQFTKLLHKAAAAGGFPGLAKEGNNGKV